MKKRIIAGGIFLGVMLALLIALPLFFRNPLLEMTKNTINRKLDATVNFEKFRLSLIKSFPKVNIALDNLVVTGKGNFNGDTLLAVKSLQTSVGLFDLFTPENLTIHDLIIRDARLNLLVDSLEKANWKVFPDSEKTPESGKEEDASSLKMKLDKIDISNSWVSYNDLGMPLKLELGDINLLVKGDMYGNNTRLNASGYAGQTELEYDRVTYISKVRLDINSNLDIDFNKWLFQFDESELLVNKLPLEMKGNFSMPGDSMLFDLGFMSKVSDISEYLKLVPPDYIHYIDDLKTSGKADLKGSFKGLLYEETYPALDVSFNLTGNAKYAGLPEEIKNIRAILSVNKPQGGFNLTTVNVSDAHAEIRSNPVNVRLKIANLMEDIHFNGNFTGKVNFDHLRDAIPMDSLQISGLLDANLGVEGNMSAIESKKYQLLKTDGSALLTNISIAGKNLAYPVVVSSGEMDFTPEQVNLRQLNLKIGESLMAIAGSVSDYYPYIFSEGTLRGNVSLVSDHMNLNQLMALQKTDPPKKVESPAPGTKGIQDTTVAVNKSFSLPEKLNLTFHTDIKKAVYEKMIIDNISGQVTLNNGRLDLTGMNMHMLEGEFKLSGIYEDESKEKRNLDLTAEIVNVDIPKAFQSLQLVRNYLPIAAQSKGKFSTTLKLKSSLDQNLNMVMESLNGSGLFSSQSIQVINSPVFNQVKSILNEEKLRNLKIDDFVTSFTIANGNLLLKPFKTKISGQEATFSGSLNANNLLEMKIDFLISREALSSNIENTLGILPGQSNIRMIPVTLNIKGPVKNPDVKVDLSDARKMISQEVKNASREELQKTINKLGDGLKKLFK